MFWGNFGRILAFFLIEIIRNWLRLNNNENVSIKYRLFIYSKAALDLMHLIKKENPEEAKRRGRKKRKGEVFHALFAHLTHNPLSFFVTNTCNNKKPNDAAVIFTCNDDDNLAFWQLLRT